MTEELQPVCDHLKLDSRGNCTKCGYDTNDYNRPENWDKHGNWCPCARCGK